MNEGDHNLETGLKLATLSGGVVAGVLGLILALSHTTDAIPITPVEPFPSAQPPLCRVLYRHLDGTIDTNFGGLATSPTGQLDCSEWTTPVDLQVPGEMPTLPHPKPETPVEPHPILPIPFPKDTEQYHV